jgi:gamma-glutamyltranspeptidase / glutathione hydrolase
MGMQEAVDARRVHSQWLPDVIVPESGAISKKDSIALTRMGHKIPRQRETIGRVDAILVLHNGKLEAGADHSRGDDEAEGYE